MCLRAWAGLEKAQLSLSVLSCTTPPSFGKPRAYVGLWAYGAYWLSQAPLSAYKPGNTLLISAIIVYPRRCTVWFCDASKFRTKCGDVQGGGSTTKEYKYDKLED